MAITATRLRWAILKDEEALGVFVNSLPFKIEIKEIGPPVNGKGVRIVFVLPEEEQIKFNSTDFRSS